MMIVITTTTTTTLCLKHYNMEVKHRMFKSAIFSSRSSHNKKHYEVQ